MKKIVVTYGLIAGTVIICSIILGAITDSDSKHLAAQEWLGYLIMIVAFSLIFFGIKQYRDRDLGGVIRFGTALTAGLGISLVASVIYVVSWEINLAATDYAFIDDYAAAIIEQKREQGASAEEMLKVQAEMQTMTEQYAQLPYRLLMTFLEIFPVGLLISLISSALLRKSSLLPASSSG